MSTLIERMTSAGSEGARRATGDLADRGAQGQPKTGRIPRTTVPAAYSGGYLSR